MSHHTSIDPHVADTRQQWSVRMADSVLARHPVTSAKWHYEHGLMLLALERVWRASGDERTWRYVRDVIDFLMDDAGCIRNYAITDFNLDQINPGRSLYALLRETGDARYWRAIHRLREQLSWQPRTREGGFWHKLIYPHQIWLDGVYMAGPFLAEYAATYNEPDAFDEVVREILLVEQHLRDSDTGLFYHGWDESRLQRWANRDTGCSPHFWGRAIGWYAMAIVDVLDTLPAAHPERDHIVAILGGLVAAVARVQDQASGVWYQILDQGERPGNYLEASASSMFVYAIAKGVRRGYLDASWLEIARRGYDGILNHFIVVDEQGMVSLTNVCSVGGLGGNPYRDGSFQYYIGEPVVVNDYKGVGSFIMASIEIEAARG
jgi:unsaturated rhamnogalacturonyl hydrolase